MFDVCGTGSVVSGRCSGDGAVQDRFIVCGVVLFRTGAVLVSFPDPTFTLDKGLEHFARNLGLADSALPEICQIAYTC